MANTYDPPLALTIIGSIFIGTAGLVAIWIAADIVIRKGWRSMMGIMIPVYVLNATYLAPLTLWTYLKYGRPPPPTSDSAMKPHCHSSKDAEKALPPADGGKCHSADADSLPTTLNDSDDGQKKHCHSGKPSPPACHQSSPTPASDVSSEPKQHACHGGGDRPMFATITVAVCHCGAGCLLGDIIGEWLVYGADISINGRQLWPEYLLDYAFAMLIGVFFQYFSIAPMSGEWGLRTVWRSAKADFLSLTFFQIGLFGWMAIYQVAIFNWQLQTNNVVYWWMMQIGMFCGHWTAFPINYYLIKTGVKEPCA